jgi:hypothetical protein
VSFPSPHGPLAQVLPPVNIPVPCVHQPPCFPTYPMTFIGSPVLDNNSGQALADNRASSYSIFSADLLSRDLGGAKHFTLNRFNFDSAHSFLLPRAVAYSASFIDYFFRGYITYGVWVDDGEILISNWSDDALGDGHTVDDDLNTFRAGGRFEVYYETLDGSRHPITSLSNLELSEDMAVDDYHLITGLDTALMSINKWDSITKLIVMFDGIIGSERGITGRQYDAQCYTSNGFDHNLDIDPSVVFSNYNSYLLTREVCSNYEEVSAINLCRITGYNNCTFDRLTRTGRTESGTHIWCEARSIRTDEKGRRWAHDRRSYVPYQFSPTICPPL